MGVPGGDARARRRIPGGRRNLPQPVGGVDLRAPARLARGDALDRARRQWPAADGDPVGRSGPLPRTQAPVPPAAQPQPVSGAGLHDPVWQSEAGAGGRGPDDRDLRVAGGPRRAGGQAARAAGRHTS